MGTLYISTQPCITKELGCRCERVCLVYRDRKLKLTDEVSVSFLSVRVRHDRSASSVCIRSTTGSLENRLHCAHLPVDRSALQCSLSFDNHHARRYIGNLAFATTELQIYDLFRRAGTFRNAAAWSQWVFAFGKASFTGDVKRIIMGLNQKSNKPCGFCFVE